MTFSAELFQKMKFALCVMVLVTLVTLYECQAARMDYQGLVGYENLGTNHFASAIVSRLRRQDSGTFFTGYRLT